VPFLLWSVDVGVGHNPEPFPAVGRSDLGSRDTIPFRIVPRRGQVPEDSSEISAGNKSGNVLQEDESRLYFANDTDCLWPEVAVVVRAFSLSRDRERLARETRSDNVNAAIPGKPVERSGVIPDREQW
jgi:hypothetical protein